jgi:hypothetical protein
MLNSTVSYKVSLQLMKIYFHKMDLIEGAIGCHILLSASVGVYCSVPVICGRIPLKEENKMSTEINLIPTLLD